jgi:Domain of unknown function (DUF1707)
MTDSFRVPCQFGDGHLRVGDGERDHALDALGKHYAAGRLSAEELEDRISAALRARTRSDLSVLFRDLPGNQAAWQSMLPTRPNYWSLAGRILAGAAVTTLVLGLIVALLFVVLAATMMAFGGLVWLVLLWWLLAATMRRGYRRHGNRAYRRQAYWPSRGCEGYWPSRGSVTWM